MRTSCILALSAVVAVALVQPHVGADAVSAPGRDDLIRHLAAPDDRPLLGYRALRHMTASARGGRTTGSMEVRTSLTGDRFDYEILAESGSSIIRNKVLRAALEAEAKSQTRESREQSALTEANYTFLDMTAAPENLIRLDIRPKRQHVMLVEGALFFEDGSNDLLRVDGELSKRPSFWTRRVHVTREYERIGGVHVPVAMRSTADVLLVGESTFSMTYQYEEINGEAVAVAESNPRAAAPKLTMSTKS